MSTCTVLAVRRTRRKIAAGMRQENENRLDNRIRTLRTGLPQQKSLLLFTVVAGASLWHMWHAYTHTHPCAQRSTLTNAFYCREWHVNAQTTSRIHINDRPKYPTSEWLEQLKAIKRDKFFVSACVVAKYEGFRLVETIVRNLMAGIEHFFIIDNNDEDTQEDLNIILKPLIQLGRVSLVRHTGAMDAHSANVCVEKFRNNSEWLAIIDADEVITLTSSLVSLRTILSRCEDCGALGLLMVSVPPIHVSHSGNIISHTSWTGRWGAQLRFSPFLCSQADTPKFIVRPSFQPVFEGPHKVSFSSDGEKVPANEYGIQNGQYSKELVFLMHPHYKSVEELIIKRKRMTAPGQTSEQGYVHFSTYTEAFYVNFKNYCFPLINNIAHREEHISEIEAILHALETEALRTEIDINVNFTNKPGEQKDDFLFEFIAEKIAHGLEFDDEFYMHHHRTLVVDEKNGFGVNLPLLTFMHEHRTTVDRNILEKQTSWIPREQIYGS